MTSVLYDKKRILKLASTSSLDHHRDEHGRLKLWYEWAATHPQRDRIVRVCCGREGWEASNRDAASNHSSKHYQGRLSIVSWNTLSDTWYEQGARSGTYDHTPRNCGKWEGRFPLLLQWIFSLRPDVLALQEVDYHRFESHWLPALQAMGYDGLIQREKRNKSKSDQPCGVATFWWREKLELLDHRMGSRSLATNFRFRTHQCTNQSHRQACIINVHLECGHQSSYRGDTSIPNYAKTMRVGQLNAPLLWASQRLPPSASLVLCGDFNTSADNSLLRVLRTETWHGHGFASVYEHPATADTLPVLRDTTCAIPHQRYAIDQLLYAHSTTILSEVLDPLTSSEAEEHLEEKAKGFPSAFCPSDHLPIGAVFVVPEQPFSESSSVPALPTYTEEELEAALDSVLRTLETTTDCYFARDGLHALLRLLTRRTFEKLGCSESSDNESDAPDQNRERVEKFVKKHIGKEYGRWKVQRQNVQQREP
mmetsp:Transcript_1362/g.3503  ORF Transcript_1362/g.3503 Transcript_1362/m.3503 type:complete len:480 (+) Transcript_1362:200-1639(+)|eukprot:CAMPEP_0172379374 /NCGR_PEP_ID=MMETSP1060-20121228/69896_1 /TAXON_ID=37318 /ORGANISM="Pseudo-nitzschia pungens, Strain cf. cingulata" /LENGTH=479 /DNA_ID=CAMNT_0013107115 /DNA_START=187 /DNA_END=1626 /DNA_ORIENTATION=+